MAPRTGKHRAVRARRGALDLATVTVLLYTCPFDPARWHEAGAATLARYCARMAADPRADVARLRAGLAAAQRRNSPLLDRAHLAAAQAFAPAVLAAAAA